MAEAEINDNLVLKQHRLTAEECLKTPAEELEIRLVIARMFELEAERDELQRRVNNLEKIVYGPKTEKTEVVLEGGVQMNMFDEAEAESDEKIVPEEQSVKVAEHTRKAKATHKDTFESGFSFSSKRPFSPFPEATG